METINDRIEIIFNESGMKKTEFAKKMNVSQAYISKLIVAKERTPSDRFLNDFCRQFHVQKEWLINGVGEKHYTDFISIVKNADLDEIDKEIIMAYATATKDQKDFIKTLIKNVAQKMNLLDYDCENEATKPDEELTVDEELEKIRPELEAQKKNQMLSVSTTINGLLNQEKINNS